LHSLLGRTKNETIARLNGAEDRTNLGRRNCCGGDKKPEELKEFIDTTGLR